MSRTSWSREKTEVLCRDLAAKGVNPTNRTARKHGWIGTNEKFDAWLKCMIRSGFVRPARHSRNRGIVAWSDEQTFQLCDDLKEKLGKIPTRGDATRAGWRGDKNRYHRLRQLWTIARGLPFPVDHFRLENDRDKEVQNETPIEVIAAQALELKQNPLQAMPVAERDLKSGRPIDAETPEETFTHKQVREYRRAAKDVFLTVWELRT